MSFSFLSSAYCSIFFFFNDTATTEIYTLSLHDALPISHSGRARALLRNSEGDSPVHSRKARMKDRKSTRLNSSHTVISYAVFCLKKKKLSHQSVLANQRVDDVTGSTRVAP